MNKVKKIALTLFVATATVLVVSCGNHQSSDTSMMVPVMSEVAAVEEQDRNLRQRSTQRMMMAEAKQAKLSKPKKIISWKPSSQADNNAIIKLGENEQLNPEALDVSVQIDGFRARVVIDGFYTNPHDRNLEGSFKFRLPNGAIPYFFAFGQTSTTIENDFNTPIHFDPRAGNLAKQSMAVESQTFLSPQSIMQQRNSQWLAPKEAVMVSKEKAAFAYNDTVARQVDPALLEWAGAGVFSAKVFPLQAKQTHRVVIGYDLDLRQVNGDLFLDLPVVKDKIKKRFNLLINKKGAQSIYVQRILDEKLQAKEVISKNNELVQQVIEGDLLQGLRITVEQHSNVALVGDDKAGRFFAKQWKVQLPEEDSRSMENAIFVLDTSLSASPEKFHLWVKLIENILVENEQSLKQFSLLNFSVGQHWWKDKFVENNARNRSKLKSYLNKLILEGATDLSRALNQAAAPNWLAKDSEGSNNSNNYDVFLLSDGAITWGENDPYFISESIKQKSSQQNNLQQIFTYRFGQSGENASMLNHLTREIGGGSYQLTDERDIKTLATAHKVIPWDIKSLTLNGAKDIIISGRQKSLFNGQLITISGRFEKELGNNLELVMTQSAKQISNIITMENKIDSSLASRVYGQIAVAQLETVIALERKVASAYANHFRIPGQSSSLLMLESKQDYQRYNIKPAEDAFVVSHKLVNDVFAKLADGFVETLSNPKKRMLEQLSKLQKMTFLKFSLSDAATILIDDLPKDAFSLDTDSISMLKIKKTTRGGVPSNYLKNLQPSKINYAILNKESQRRLDRYSKSDSLKVMSSLVEEMPSDVSILRDVAFSAENLGLYLQAFNLHLAAAKQRPYEPQSYTYLAKLAEKLNRNDLALIYYEIGLSSRWSGRFGDYELIHKVDYANFLRKAIKQQSSIVESKFYSLDYAKLKLKTLANEINLTGSDLIVSISWNTDRTDIDLHVTEPSGEVCFYENKTTRSGGFITTDVTQGYGPEMYVNKTAPKGKYKIHINYYSSDQNKLGLKTKVQIRTIRNWGTGEESEILKTVSLDSQKEKQLIDTIKL